MAEASTATAPPIMDVVAPPAESGKSKQSNVSTSPHKGAAESEDPLDKLVAQDQEERQVHAEEKASPARQSVHQTKAAQQKTTTGAPGVGLAITATVVIVLGLAMLATYAYIQTNS